MYLRKKVFYFSFIISVVLMASLLEYHQVNATARYTSVQVSDVGTDNSISYGNTARKLAVSSDGTIYAVFYGSNGIRVARSVDEGGSFQPSVQVDSANRQPEIAVSSDDTVYVAWTDTSGNVCLSKSTDKGISFSVPQNIGSSGATSNAHVHMTTYGKYLYLIPKNGKILFISTDSGQQFTTYTWSTSYSFSDVHVDSQTGHIYVQKDNPTVVYFKSTDNGTTFGSQQSGGGSVFYSVGTLSSGPKGTYLFISGKGTSTLRINLADNTNTALSFPNSSYNYGRSIATDEYGNVITGYSDGTKVYYSISNDLGNTFTGNTEVATTNMSNIGINPTNGDIMFLYASGGQIYLSTYKDELKGYIPSLSKNALFFDSSKMQQSVTVTNTSGESIMIQDLSISGEFSQTSTCQGTISAGESCQINVTFSPTSLGSKSGQLSIKTSAFDNPRTVSLAGTFAITELTYAIESLSNQTATELTAGYASNLQETKTITVMRTGSGDLTNLAVALSGTNASAFDITQPMVTTLDSGTPSTTFTVKAKDGLAAGTYTATVTVSADNMTNETFTVTQVVNPAPTYNVTYDGNGHTGGSVPTDSGSYQEEATVTVLGNTGNLEKTGYTFTGWNTAADGSGESYAANETFSMGTANVTLYAQWMAKLNTTTSLSTSADLVGAGESVTLTAIINESEEKTPTGTVTFKSGTDELATVAVGGNAQATYTTSTLPAGTTLITAEYSGDTYFLGSVSNDITQKVYVKLWMPHVTGRAGEVVKVPVKFSSTGDVVGLQFDLSFDSELLTLQDVAQGSLLCGVEMDFDYNPLGNGNYRFVIANVKNINISQGTSELLELTFAVKDTAVYQQKTALTLVNPVMVNSKEQEITEQFEKEDGSITVIDDQAPTVELSASPSGPTNQSVTIAVYASGTGSNLKLKKWAKGNYSVTDFVYGDLGTKLVGDSFNVNESGTYTVYVEDEAGNSNSDQIEVIIDQEEPSISFGLTPSDSEASVTAAVYADGTGSMVSEMKVLEGIKSLADFAGNASASEVTYTADGNDATGSFEIRKNVAYTVYIKDAAGNETVQTVYVMGDINFNQAVDVTDWVEIVNYILEKSVPSAAQNLVADLNTDNKLNVLDPVIVANIIIQGGPAQYYAIQ